MKRKVDKLDIGKLETTWVHLNKLSNVVKNEVIKKTKYNELVKKVNAIKITDTSNLVNQPDYDTKINKIEKKSIDHDHSNKYITTQEFNKLTAENFAPRLVQEKLVSKADITDFIKNDRFWR